LLRAAQLRSRARWPIAHPGSLAGGTLSSAAHRNRCATKLSRCAVGPTPPGRRLPDTRGASVDLQLQRPLVPAAHEPVDSAPPFPPHKNYSRGAFPEQVQQETTSLSQENRRAPPTAGAEWRRKVVRRRGLARLTSPLCPQLLARGPPCVSWGMPRASSGEVDTCGAWNCSPEPSGFGEPAPCRERLRSASQSPVNTTFVFSR
jgi:hypothetical protein